MSELQAQSQQQAVSNDKAEFKEEVHKLIANHANSILGVTTYLACVVAFPIVTFFLTLHEVYGGDISQARNAAIAMAGLVTSLYLLGFIINKKTNKTKPIDEAKKEQ